MRSKYNRNTVPLVWHTSSQAIVLSPKERNSSVACLPSVDGLDIAKMMYLCYVRAVAAGRGTVLFITFLWAKRQGDCGVS